VYLGGQVNSQYFENEHSHEGTKGQGMIDCDKKAPVPGKENTLSGKPPRGKTIHGKNFAPKLPTPTR